MPAAAPRARAAPPRRRGGPAAPGTPARPSGAAQLPGGPPVRVQGAAAKDPKFKKVLDDVERSAEVARKHAPASKKAHEAQAAAKGPPNEKTAGAKAVHVDTMQGAAPGKGDPDSFLTLLREEIARAMPATNEDASEFMEGNEPQQIKGAMTGNLSQEKEKVAGPVQAAKDQKLDPSAVPATEGGTIPGEPAPVPPPVNAANAVPDPRPDAAISQKKNKDDADKQLADAKVTPKQLKKANDPRFSAVLDAKSNVEKVADASPAKYRAGETQALVAGVSKAQSDGKQGLVQLATARVGGNNKVKSRQQLAKEKDEAKRKEVTDTIERIYQKTKSTVEAKLQSLEDDVTRIFDAGIASAMDNFKTSTNREIDAFYDDRYSGVFGWTDWIADKFKDTPQEVKDIIKAGMGRFTQQMDALVVRIASTVDARLKAAKDEIDRGQAEVKKYVAGLDPDLKAVGKAAEKEVAGRFNEMRQGVDDRKNALAQKLAQRYKEAHDKAAELAKKMEEENAGALNKLVGALVAVIKALLEFKNKMMALFKKGLEVIGLIIDDPIGFLGNLISAIKQGFDQFVNNIWKHLLAGFIKWLFGALAGAGIELPADLSLPSILKFVLSVLGITYPRMRAKAVKLIGERNVKIVEKLVEYLRALISGGPAALWEMVKQDLADLKKMVIDAVLNWVMETIAKQAMIKILSMLNPAGAIIQAIIAIYNIVVFVIEKAAQIMELIEAVVNSIAMIAAGSVADAANWIENALARAIPIVIGFLARLIGLGGISQKIKEFIFKVQAAVDKAIDKAIAKVVAILKKLFGGGGDGKPDERSASQKSADLHKAVTKASALLVAEDATADTVRKKLPKIKDEYKLTALELVKDREGAYHVLGRLNPEEKSPIQNLFDGLSPEIKAAIAAATAQRVLAVERAAELTEVNRIVAKGITDEARRKRVALTQKQLALLGALASNKAVAFIGGQYCVSGWSRHNHTGTAEIHDKLMARFQKLMADLQSLPPEKRAEKLRATPYIPEPHEHDPLAGLESDVARIDAKFHLSHAEKFAVQKFGGNAVGVSLPMCEDCQDFFAARAKKQKSFIVVVDPQHVRVFLRNLRLTL